MQLILAHGASQFSALQTGQCIISSCNIGQYKKVLADYGFFACHKSHLINKSQIVRYHKDGQAEMANGDRVPVARRRKDTFYKEIISEYALVSMSVNNSLI